MNKEEFFDYLNERGIVDEFKVKRCLYIENY